MEKYIEHIGFNFINELLNIEQYETTKNDKLFKNKIPDGYLLKDNNLLIIEYKPNEQKKLEGIKQLSKYSLLVPKEYNIYCFLGIGSSIESFITIFYRFLDGHLIRIEKERIKEIFSNSIKTNSIQFIHDSLVSNFKYDKQEELYTLLTIIITSFLNDELKELYKTNTFRENFNELLIENAKRILNDSKYDKYLETIRRTDFNNSFKVCKSIYNLYQNDYSSISKLFQQFKKYNRNDISKNQIWTEGPIVKIMYNELMNIISEHLGTVCDPCIGGGNLLKEFISMNQNIFIKGLDIDNNFVMNNKLEYIIKGIQNDLIHSDYFDINNERLISDVTICNPPYTYKLSHRRCFEFVYKSLQHSKMVCYIFPKDKIIKESEWFNKCLSIGKVLKIIELGKIFKGVAGTSDIMVIYFQSSLRNDNKDYKIEDYEIELIDYSLLDNKEYYQKLPRCEKTITNKGIELIQSRPLKKISLKNYIKSINSYFDIFESIKDKRLEIYRKRIEKNQNDFNESLISENELRTINEIYENRMKKIEVLEGINIFSLFGFDINRIKKVKFTDYFEFIKFKSIPSNYDKEGEYPLIAAKKTNNGIVKYIDKYSFDTNNETFMTLVKNGDGGSGYCFLYKGKIAISSSVYLLKPLKNIDLNENVKIITFQLTNMGFDFIIIF